MAASPPTFDRPRLLADIGSSFARFALETAPGRFRHVTPLRCADHADLEAAIAAYRAMLPAGTAPIAHAAIAIANPVDRDAVRMTNAPWQFSITRLRERLRLQTLMVVNDFTALAMAVPRLAAHDRRQVGGGLAREGSVIGVLGPGTGLGVSGLVPAPGGWVALGAEGGHATFAPQDERELAVLRFAWRQHPHVSFERLLSGPGLMLIHQALADQAGAGTPPFTAPEITQRALDGRDGLCAEAVDTFCAMLGTAAGNLAVTLGAQGGIYLGGGIVPRLGAHLDRSPFRARFEAKGRFSDYLRAIPTHVITAEDATLHGASAILQAQLRSMDDAPPSALLDQIRGGLATLSPAERRVAQHVLAQPRGVLNEPVAEIARAAQVSQPTVIRFCRSLGCEGLPDFKLRLAASLTGAVPVAHSRVSGDDSSTELGAKVLGNTASAILRVRGQLNRDGIDRAIGLLNAAGRIDVHASALNGPVAQDAQYKFMRLGLPAHAYTDTRLQALAAGTLAAGDVVVLIGGAGAAGGTGGRAGELVAVADTARERGARVIAITAGQSALAKKADVVLAVDPAEDPDKQLPMISRILQLLVIDILAVGVSMRREGAGLTAHAHR